MKNNKEYLKGESKGVLIVVNGEEVLINPKITHTERMDLFDEMDDAKYKHKITIEKGMIVKSEFENE